MKTVKTFTRDSLVSNYAERLNELNTKISNIKRLLSYYDVFNITEVVESFDEFAIKLNALMPNSSLVINTDPFEYAGEIYSRGDFVLKDINENVVHIEAKASGIYYPSLTQDSAGNLQVLYTYSGTQPIPGKKEYNLQSTDYTGSTEPFAELQFTGISQTDGQIYAYSGPVSGWNQRAINIKGSTEYVQPVLKFYLVNDKNEMEEEISLEYSLKLIDVYQTKANPETDQTKTNPEIQEDTTVVEKRWRISFMDDNESKLFNSLYVKVK